MEEENEENTESYLEEEGNLFSNMGKEIYVKEEGEGKIGGRFF